MKHKNLQPWIDYFQMLRTYEEKGYLYIKQEEREAYVTEPALYTLTPGGFETGDKTLSDIGYIRQAVASAIPTVVRRLRTYAAWRAVATVPEASSSGTPYDSRPFAVHVVKPDAPHDLLHTIVLTTSRPWWKLWMKHDHYEVIDYRERPTVPPSESSAD